MKKDRIEIYASLEYRGTEMVPVWRWRYRRKNSQILAGPQESYTKRVHCIAMAKLVTNFDARDDLDLVGPYGEDWSGRVYADSLKSDIK